MPTFSFLLFIIFDHSISQPYNPMGMIGNISFMCYQYNGISCGMYLSKDLHDLIRSFCIQVSCWFIGKNDGWIIYQCPGNSYPLGLSAA